MSRIIRVSDAPLPSPDPWATDAPGARRCPSCGLADPGERRCRGCGAALLARANRRRPLSANLANLIVVMVGRGPLLLAVAALFQFRPETLLSPWVISFVAQTPLLWLAAAGLALRLRAAWFLAFGVGLADMAAAIVLQLALGGPPVVPLAAVLTDLMLLGFLLTVYDELRVELAAIDVPPEHAMPKTALAAYNAGVELSKVGRWYLAARLWQRAVALEHHEGRYRRALGLAYLRLGLPAAAAAELRAAVALMPDDRDAAELLRRAEAAAS